MVAVDSSVVDDSSKAGGAEGGGCGVVEHKVLEVLPQREVRLQSV